MASQIKLTDLPPDSLRFSTRKQMVRIDDDPREVEQTYLTIQGTPETYQWLSTLLSSMVKSAAKSDNPEYGHAVIVAPYDLPQVTMSDWTVLEIDCRKELP